MTPVRGEESPTPLGDEIEAIVSHPVVCISPVVNCCQLAEASSGVLFPVVANDHVPAPAEEDKIDGETFSQRMTRFGIATGTMVWRSLYIDFQAEVRRLAENPDAEPAAKTRRQGDVEADGEEEHGEGEPVDDDGAIVFEGMPAEGRAARLPPDVPIP